MMVEDFSKYNGEGTLLRDVQKKMLTILIEVDKICRQNDIPYWIDYGTLLGAIRHGGFVPWDDDLDICIMEEHFEKFQEVCLRELPENLFLQNEKTDPLSSMGNGLIKIRDKESLYIHDFENFRKKYNKGIFIDVFKCRSYSKMPMSLLKFLIKNISKSFGFSHYNPPLNFKNIICFFIYPILYPIHKSILSILNNKKTFYVGCAPERSTYKEIHYIHNLFPLQEITFENHKFMAPNNPDAFLRDEYGDYMQIPPVEKRRTHVSYVFLNRQDGLVK